MAFHWRATSAPVQTRYDDIWFINPQIGWGVMAQSDIQLLTDWIAAGAPVPQLMA